MAVKAGKKILTMGAALLLAGAVAFAQGPPGDQQTMPPGQQTPGEPNSPNNPNSPAYPPGAPEGPGGQGNSMSQSYADQQFITHTLSNSAAEAEMSKLAAEKSSSPDIKSYGQKMVQIHSELSTQLKPVAQTLGVKADPKPSKKDRKQIDQLKTLSGDEFDQAYIKAMVRDQRHDVKAFKDEQTAAQSPTIKQAARMDEPVLSQHLQVLEQIAQNHKVSLDAGQ